MDREAINQEVASEIDEVRQQSPSVISIPPVHSDPVQPSAAESVPAQPIYRWVSSEEEFCVGVAKDVEGRAEDVGVWEDCDIGPVHGRGMSGLVASKLRE